MTIKTREEFVEILRAEIEDAGCSIDDLEDVIASSIEDMSFIKGRMCLACSILHLLGEEPV